MATVTLVINLRRTDGRNPVDPALLAETLVDQVADALMGSGFDIEDEAGEDAFYEITRVRYLDDGKAGVTNTVEGSTPCEYCGNPVTSEPSGRPRLYCSDPCRQAAYRQRQTRVSK